jgi:hypothetical protein
METRRGGKQHSNGGGEDDGGEDVGDGLEAGEQSDAAGDEEATHQDGAGDSPEEHLGLMRGLNPKGAEEHQEDEEIVDGHRLFEHVAGEVLQGAGGARAETQEEAEGQGCCDPERGSGDGGAQGIAMQPDLAASVNQLDGKQEQEREVEADPVGDGRGGHVTMLSRVRTVYVPVAQC